MPDLMASSQLDFGGRWRVAGGFIVSAQRSSGRVDVVDLVAASAAVMETNLNEP
jgi:hypothetical protein